MQRASPEDSPSPRQAPHASQETDRTETPPRLTLEPEDSKSGDECEASREDAYPKSEEPEPPDYDRIMGAFLLLFTVDGKS